MRIPIFEPELTNTERINLLDAFDSGWISSQGNYVTDFQNAFAKYHEVPYAIATSNCTTALHLALTALNIGNGDEVICPDLTFIAPANMIRLVGAKPVLVDIENGSWAIDPDKIIEKVTDKTKAIIVVHPFGHSANMDAILKISQEFGLKIIEDVAEAPGAYYNGKLLGTFGDISCFSFFANKIMTTGEGGMVLTSDKKISEKLVILRDHGMSSEKKYVHVLPGFNYRMTNMQAAIGLAQLNRFETILTKRERQIETYKKFLLESEKLECRPIMSSCKPVHWLTTIVLMSKEQRDPLVEYLNNQNIDIRQMVFPVHMAPYFLSEYKDEDFPVSTDISLRSIHLPSSTNLDKNTIKKICHLIINWLDKN